MNTGFIDWLRRIFATKDYPTKERTRTKTDNEEEEEIEELIAIDII